MELSCGSKRKKNTRPKTIDKHKIFKSALHTPFLSMSVSITTLKTLPSLTVTHQTHNPVTTTTTIYNQQTKSEMIQQTIKKKQRPKTNFKIKQRQNQLNDSLKCQRQQQVRQKWNRVSKVQKSPPTHNEGTQNRDGAVAGTNNKRNKPSKSLKLCVRPQTAPGVNHTHPQRVYRHHSVYSNPGIYIVSHVTWIGFYRPAKPRDAT